MTSALAERLADSRRTRLAEVMREDFQAKALEVPALGGIEGCQQQLLHRPDRRKRTGERLAARRRDAHEPHAPVRCARPNV